jgi:hypothetical protein
MTRGNINFISQKWGESPKTLFFYWNGDQYPSGIRDGYNVLRLVCEPITKKSFKEWAKNNYEGVKVKAITQPKVYYTDGFITDYSYVFEENSVKVWEWDKPVFNGTRAEFISWIKKQ